MGGFGCPICSEQLHQLPAEALTQFANSNSGQDVNISTTPCGHIFHTYCIQKWLSGTLASSKHCPCCRKVVPGSRVLPLYPNGYEESFVDSQESSPQADHSHCNFTIGSLKTQLETVKDKLDDSETMLKMSQDEIEDMRKKYQREKVRTEQMTYQWKIHESYKDLSEQKERECVELKTILKKYQKIESLVHGAQSEVEANIDSYPVSFESIRTLLEMQTVLEGEIKGAARSLAKSKEEHDMVRSEKMKLSGRLHRLQKDYDEMRRVFDKSFSGSDSPQRVITVTGPRTPLPMPNGFKVPKNVKGFGEVVDDDVALMQPFGSKVSKKTIKAKEVEAGHNSLKKRNQMEMEVIAKESSLFKKCRSESNLKGGRSTETDLEPRPSTSKAFLKSSSSASVIPASGVQKKISKLTTCDLTPITKFNQTIDLTSTGSDEEYDFDSPMPLRGNVPGMKITTSSSHTNSKPLPKFTFRSKDKSTK